MILIEMATPTHSYTYTKERAAAREWHKYVIHNLRHGDKTARLIAGSKEWCLENIEPGGWLIHVMDRDACALFYIADDQDACLFELTLPLARADKRGKVSS